MSKKVQAITKTVSQAMRLTSKQGKIVSKNASIEVFKDGFEYQIPDLAFSVDGALAYSRVAIMEKVVIKLATYQGFSEYKKNVVSSKLRHNEIRKLEELEDYKNYSKLLARYSGLSTAHSEYGGQRLHYLLLHRLQYDRLLTQDYVVIPAARFVIVLKKVFGLLSAWQPAIIQSKVSGILLWDMFEHGRRTIHPEYSDFKKAISEQLLPLAYSKLSPHINWNIKNFIFNLSKQRLYYIDSKPSLMIDNLRNRQNLRNIKKDFAE